LPLALSASGRNTRFFSFFGGEHDDQKVCRSRRFVALSLTSTAFAEPEQLGTTSPSQAIADQPSTTPAATVDEPNQKPPHKMTASKPKAKLSSKTNTGQTSANPSPTAAAEKPKANAASKLTASKPRAVPSPKAVAGRPKANPSLNAIASTNAHPVPKAAVSPPPTKPAANSSVANANAALLVRPHRLLIQVDQNDPAVMNLALNNATNMIDYYRAKHQDVQVDLVTYGPGLNMLREDTSPVKDRIKQLKDYAFPSTIQFSACGNTKENMEKKEEKPISIVADAVLVPSGVVHLMELQEQGWSYLRP
jgi:intracellular sulfur oxidation DsrE/DsrF family protein